MSFAAGRMSTTAAGSREPAGVQQSQASRAASAPAAVMLCGAVMKQVGQLIPQLLATDRKLSCRRYRAAALAQWSTSQSY